MDFDEIIGLGGNCETAQHIRRHFGVSRAWPFDWWITPFHSLLALLDADMGGLFQPGDMEMMGRGTAVRSRRFGIIHHHDFPRDAEARVIADQVPANLVRLREKYTALTARMDAACHKGARILFVRSWREILHTPPGYPASLIDGVPSYTFARLIGALEDRYPGTEFRVLFVNYGRQQLDHPRAFFHNVRDLADAKDWSGSPGGWDEMFARFGVALGQRDAAALVSPV